LSVGPFGTGGMPRARTAAARVTGLEQEIVIELTGVQPLTVEVTQLTSLAYPREPLHDAPAEDPPDAADVPLQEAQQHPIRRQLPMLLDQALNLILHPAGPAREVILAVNKDGTARMTILLRAPRAARLLGLVEWIHALRIINLWYYHGWYITATTDRRYRKSLEVYDIESEVSDLAENSDADIIRILSAVMARHAVRALNCMLRVPQDEV
jgi:hypothetical protein